VKPIELFMWGFQPHFRINIESSIERGLRDLGLDVEAKVFLVGLLQEEGKGHPLCIEPEDDVVRPADFAGLQERARKGFEADPETAIFHSDRRTHELRQKALLNAATGNAICEVLEAKTGLAFFNAMPARVESYSVYTAIGLPQAGLATVPQLGTSHAEGDDRMLLSRSLIDAAILEFLPKVTQALYRPDPGASLSGPIESEELSRLAGERFAIDVAYRANPTMPAHGLFQATNQIATTAYERRAGVGRLVLTRAGSDDLEETILLNRPVPVRQTRALRKLLETSSPDGAAVLMDGAIAFGLGSIKSTYEAESERTYEIIVSGPGSWDLRHAGTPLMSVQHGTPRLPAPRLSRAKFDDIANRLFTGVGGADTDRLWSCAEAAAEAEHGTMLVISAAASTEAERLEGQAFSVREAHASPDLIRQVSRIDGAILVDPSGQLAAIGVILDGVATPEGDRARGARFNSAVRYLAEPRPPTMIVLVSEDGMLDVLPDLRPQVRRSDVESAMAELRNAADLDPVDRARFSQAFDRLRATSFYLSSAQCEEANALAQKQRQREEEAGFGLFVVLAPLKPDPKMNDDYFLD
jgi:hypothetical protein